MNRAVGLEGNVRQEKAKSGFFPAPKISPPDPATTQSSSRREGVARLFRKSDAVWNQ